MAKRAAKKTNSGVRQDGRRNGKKWKGGIAPENRKPGDKGYSFKPDVLVSSRRGI